MSSGSVVGTPTSTSYTAMKNYNWFGATSAEMLLLLPNTVETDFGGLGSIEQAMDIIESEIIGGLNVFLKSSLTYCFGAEIVNINSDGTIANVTIDKNWGITYANASNVLCYTDVVGPSVPNDSSDKIDVTLSDAGSGELKITFTGGAIAKLKNVVMTCVINPKASDFTLPTLKQIQILGVAQMLGQRIYTPEDTNLPNNYHGIYKKRIEELSNKYKFCRHVPELDRRNELRFQNFASALFTGKLL